MFSIFACVSLFIKVESAISGRAEPNANVKVRMDDRKEPDINRAKVSFKFEVAGVSKLFANAGVEKFRY